MLVLSRKEDETIVLRDARTHEQIACLTVNKIRGAQVQLGVDAPKWVLVERDNMRKGPGNAIPNNP